MGRACSMHEEKRVLTGKPEGTRPQKNLDVGGRIILRWILEKYDGVIWTGFIWLRIKAIGGLLRRRK
jgi:hypothetical protein